jgi:hypothetical protein
MARRNRFLVYVVVAATLAGVFALYTRPEFLTNLADQLWSCFLTKFRTKLAESQREMVISSYE